jgi:hypothetical protein
MESKDIIENIEEIYDRFRIPPNLREHMYKVSGVGEFIYENWRGPYFHKWDLSAFLLLHDLGNIVKFKFDENTISLLGNEEDNVEYWKEIKEETVSKYGSWAGEATINMAKELGVQEEIIYLMKNMSAKNVGKIIKEDDWTLKIALYSDYRVGPFGIITIDQRVEDIRERYGKSLEGVSIDKVKNKSKILETEIFKYCKMTPYQIKEDNILYYINNFKEFSQDESHSNLELNHQHAD